MKQALSSVIVVLALGFAAKDQKLTGTLITM
jgi:hypothetical protein